MADLIALDTNAVRALALREEAVLRCIGVSQPALPVLVIAEVAYGWLLQARKAEQRGREDLVGSAMDRLVEFLDFARSLRVLPYDADAQEHFRLVRSGRGERSRADLRIAATCLAHGASLLTRNVADFHDIPALILVTW